MRIKLSRLKFGAIQSIVQYRRCFAKWK